MTAKRGKIASILGIYLPHVLEQSGKSHYLRDHEPAVHSGFQKGAKLWSP